MCLVRGKESALILISWGFPRWRSRMFDMGTLGRRVVWGVGLVLSNGCGLSGDLRVVRAGWRMLRGIVFVVGRSGPWMIVGSLVGEMTRVRRIDRGVLFVAVVVPWLWSRDFRPSPSIVCGERMF